MRKDLSLILFGLLIFTPLVISTGCSSGLSRSKAADLISKDAQFSETKKAPYSKQGFLMHIKYGNVGLGNFFRAMESQGYIDSSGEFTEKGEKAKGNWEKKYSEEYVIPVAKRELVEVTGISDTQNPTGSFVEAIFTWHYAPMNDIGKAMNLEKELYTGKALFRKFDDGWRVQKIDS